MERHIYTSKFIIINCYYYHLHFLCEAYLNNFRITIVLLPSCKLYFQEITLCLLQITLFLYYLHFQLLLDLVNFVTSIMLVSFYYFAYFAGHAMWPAVVLDESLASNCKGLKMFLGGSSVPVQFFGTHDFARFDILWKLRKILVWMFSGRLFSLYCRDAKACA